MTEKAIDKTEPRRMTVMESLAQNQEKIEQALGGALDPVQFMSVCASIYTSTPKLKEAPWQSFVLACVEAAQLGLKPGSVLGDCYIVPRWNRNTRCQWATFLIGYRGMMKMIRRGGDFVDIIPELVYENDEFHESKGTNRGIHHVPWYCLGHEESGEVVAAYSTATANDGRVLFNVIDRATIDKAASLSGDPRNPEKVSDAWRDHWDSMALKTALRRHAKFLPAPDVIKEAIVRDEYRDAGIEDNTLSGDAYEAEREAIKAIPEVKARRAIDGAQQLAWPKVAKFVKEATGRGGDLSDSEFQRCVSWLVGWKSVWPKGREEAAELILEANADLVAWNKRKGDARQRLCEEYAAHEVESAIIDTFGNDEPFLDHIDPAKADAAFEADQAAKGGE